MVSTIVPMVDGHRLWKHKVVLAHLSGGAIGGAATGFVLSLPATWLALDRKAMFVGVSVVAAGYALHEAGILQLPTPEISKQVPNWWRRSMSPVNAGFAYGAALGTGLLTHITVSSFYVVIVWVLVRGEVGLGAAAFAIFGTARASIVPLLGRGLAHDGERLSQKLIELLGFRRRARLANVIGLSFVGGFLLGSPLHQLTTATILG